MSTYRICVVCTGNICRSPMGEFILRERFEAAGLGDQVAIDSAGTTAWEEGNPADPRTLDVRVQWADAATRSVAQEADAVVKLFAAGLLPASYALRRLGYTDADVAAMQ